MSKNLNFEYKKHIENEIPDLWNRIEEALPSKNIEPIVDVTEAVTEMGNVSDIGTDVNNVIPFENNKRSDVNRKKRKRIYAGIVAACACCAISIPAIRFMSDSAIYSEATTAACEDSAPAVEESVNYDEVKTTEEAVEATADVAEEYTQEAPAAESDYAEDAAYEDNEMSMNGNVAESAVDEVMMESEAEESAPKSYDDFDIFADVRMKVNDIYADDGRYYAVVSILNDPGDLLYEGDEIIMDITSCVTTIDNEVTLPFDKNDEMTATIIGYMSQDGDERMYELAEIVETE